MKRKGSPESSFRCEICHRRSNSLQNCCACRNRVCKTDRFWCSVPYCDWMVCSHCQDYGGVYEIKRVGNQRWFCSQHLREVCFFCGARDELNDCDRCPRTVCWRHRTVCSTRLCRFCLCDSCQDVPYWASCYTDRGIICLICRTERKTDVKKIADEKSSPTRSRSLSRPERRPVITQAKDVKRSSTPSRSPHRFVQYSSSESSSKTSKEAKENNQNM